MARLTFKDLRFTLEKDNLRIHFQKLYYFLVPLSKVEKIGQFRLESNAISFESISQIKAENKFQKLINTYFSGIISKISGFPVTYVHQNSGIPLIGSLSFGIIDKGTDILEIKPITGCNIDCIFCSVDEGASTRKNRDFLVEKDYLIHELKEVLEYKKTDCSIYINPHGEPLLYPDIAGLVRQIKSLDYAKEITVITNGLLLSEQLAIDLIDAGLDGLNISISSLDKSKAGKLSNCHGYNIDKIINTILKIKEDIKITVTPVMVQGINEEDIENLVSFCVKNDIEILIQNFQHNKRGRNPAKEMHMDKFYSMLKSLEKKHNTCLIKKFEIGKTKELPKPFKKGDIIRPENIIDGRYSGEKIIVSKARTITVNSPNDNISKVRITSDKHNIFYGTLI
jgi:uncharacterized Fe-S cluster-containing radical SAM superfamily enzyme